MITAWLTYCVLVATLLGVAAWVAERASRAQGWSGRWPWALALAGSIGLPLGAWLRPLSRSPEAASTSVLPLPGAYVMEAIPMLTLQPAAATGPSLEGLALGLWGVATAALLLYLAVSALRVRAEGRRWRRGEVDGVEVLVSEATGPAALGLFRGLVVLPEWALALDERLRRLLVLHEAEHVRAKDPQLAVAGLVTCALMPWNPALWWQLARLRLAIEMDCDARVLHRSGDPASYGSLLLEVGQRRSRLAVGLAESRSMLERRIRMLTKTTTTRRTVRALGLGAASALLLAVACETPPPTGLGDVGSQPLEVEAALAGANDLPCEPLVYVDGHPASRDALAGLDPDAIEVIEVRRGAVALEASNRMWEPGEGDGRAAGDAGCGVIFVATKAASPEALDRMRRVKEEMLADRSGPRESPTAGQLRGGPTFTPMTVPPRLTNAPDVLEALRRHYPPLLRDAGIGGEAVLWFFIDQDGRVRDTRIHRSSGHDALDQAALRVAEVMEFNPAYNRDQRVPVWIALPIAFHPAGHAAPGAVVERLRQERQAEVRRQMDATRESPSAEPAGRPAVADPRAGPVFTPMTVRPHLTNAAEVAEAIRRHHPPLLRSAGIGGTTLVWLYIDAEGVVRQARVNRSSDYDALDQAALRVAELMRFTPARNRDEAVAVWVALPITFEVR